MLDRNGTAVVSGDFQRMLKLGFDTKLRKLSNISLFLPGNPKHPPGDFSENYEKFRKMNPKYFIALNV